MPEWLEAQQHTSLRILYNHNNYVIPKEYLHAKMDTYIHAHNIMRSYYKYQETTSMPKWLHTLSV